MSRRGLLVFGLVGLLVTAAWWFLLVSPQRDREAQAATELENAEQEEFLLRTQLAQLQRIQDNELPYRAAIAELQAAIPPSPQTASLIDDLSALANETGVQWETGTYANPELDEETEILSIPIAITIRGQFFEVLGYLYGIADLDRIVRVDGVNISPSQDENGFTVLAVNITARAFTTSDIVVPVVDIDATEESEGEATPDAAEEEEGDADADEGGADESAADEAGDAATDDESQGESDSASTTTTTTVTDTSATTVTDTSTPDDGADSSADAGRRL